MRHVTTNFSGDNFFYSVQPIRKNKYNSSRWMCIPATRKALMTFCKQSNVELVKHLFVHVRTERAGWPVCASKRGIIYSRFFRETIYINIASYASVASF